MGIHFAPLATTCCGVGFSGSDQGPVGRRFSVGCLLEQTIEEQASGARLSPVESEGELIEVVVQVPGADGSLMGSQQPALRSDATRRTISNAQVCQIGDALMQETRYLQEERTA